MKWQYKVVVKKIEKVIHEKALRPLWETHLNELGSEGWELISWYADDVYTWSSGEKDYEITYRLKRQVS